MTKLPYIDSKLTDSFLKLIKRFEIKTTIEIGAHEGEFSNRVVNSTICPNVIAFEANPYVWNRFKNSLNPKIKYINMAISNYSGFVEFYINKVQDVSQTVNNSILERSNANHTWKILISCVSLSDLLPLENPIAIWIDVEGANREALSQSQEFLSQTALIFIEVEHKAYWKDQWLFINVYEFLSSQGFLLYKLKEQDAHQSNCIFINTALCRTQSLFEHLLIVRHFLIPKLLYFLLWRSRLEPLKTLILKSPFGSTLKQAYKKCRH